MLRTGCNSMQLLDAPIWTVRIEGKLTLAGSPGAGTTINPVVPGGIAFRSTRVAPLTRKRAFFR
jgi:hypothetical protein